VIIIMCIVQSYNDFMITIPSVIWHCTRVSSIFSRRDIKILIPIYIQYLYTYYIYIIIDMLYFVHLVSKGRYDPHTHPRKYASYMIGPFWSRYQWARVLNCVFLFETCLNAIMYRISRTVARLTVTASLYTYFH